MLYGKNTIGGAIRYLTRPVEAELAGTTALRLGDHGRADLKAVLNLPLGDVVATRIALASFARDSFGHNLFTGERSSATRSNLDFDLLPAQISGLTRRLEESQRSQELRLQGRAFGADALFGLYLFDGSEGGRVGSIRGKSYMLSEGEVDTRSAAVYADATWQPTRRLGIEAGFRYTRETKSARVLNRGYTDLAFTQPPGLVFANFRDSGRFGSLAPRFNASWRLGASALLYAQVARGYEAGGYNIRANTRFVPSSDRPFHDETMDTFELGAKSSWWNDRLVIDGALFRNR